MAQINTGSFVKDLFPFIGFWFGTYKRYEPEYSQVFEMKKATSKFEEFPMLSGLEVAKLKPEGRSIDYDGMKQTIIPRVEMFTYALGFQITREMIEDQQSLSLVERGSKDLKRALMEAKEQVAALVLDRSKNSSYTQINGDGVCLLSNAHPSSAGNYSNIPAVNSDLSEAALEQAEIDIAAYKDDRGILISARPQKLVVPPALKFTVKRILGSPLRVATSDNDINALKAYDILQEDPVIMHRLTASTGWYILTDVPNGLVGFNRRDDEVAQDNEFDTENARVKGTTRFAFSWIDPRGIYGDQGP